MSNHYDDLRVAPDPARAEALRRLLHERLARAAGDEPATTPRDDQAPAEVVGAGPHGRHHAHHTWPGSDVALTVDRSAGLRRRSPRRWLLAAAAVVAIVAVGTVIVTAERDGEVDTVTGIPTTADSPFTGTWVSTSTDGSSRTMYIEQWDTDLYQVTVSDEAGTVCDGVGNRGSGASLVVVAHPGDEVASVCGLELGASSTSAAVLELALDRSPVQLVDGSGSVWHQQPAPSPDPGHVALLRSFLTARVAGEGAERFVGSGFSRDDGVPLLYAATTGEAYERFEVERSQDPDGAPRYDVRLFTATGTVIRQGFGIRDQDGSPVVVYGGPTLEDGRAALVPFGFVDGSVRFAVPTTWEVEWVDDTHAAFRHRFSRAAIVIAAEPLGVGTVCTNRPAPTDAEALAGTIDEGSGVEAAGPAPVRIGGADGLQIDVVSEAVPNLCAFGASEALRGVQSEGSRMRLLLVNRPGESAGVLTLALLTTPDAFDDATAEIAPIVASIELRPD